MIRQIFKKIIIMYFVIFMSANYVFAGEWTKVKECSAGNKNLEAWYNPKYTRCRDNYVFYTMRFKEKDVGDYINLVCTNVKDMTTAVVGTSVYEKKFVPEYPEGYLSSVVFQPLDETSMLYPVAQLAIKDYERLIKVKSTSSGYSGKNGSQSVSKPKKNFIGSFFGGLATAIGVIIILPFVVLGKILGM